MLSHIENGKGTEDGRDYPALSTRDFVVNNASSWRRTRRSESWQSVRSGWPLAISLSLVPSPPVTLCLARAYPLTSVVSRSLFPSPYLSPEPVAHKLIRSRCLLARKQTLGPLTNHSLDLAILREFKRRWVMWNNYGIFANRNYKLHLENPKSCESICRVHVSRSFFLDYPTGASLIRVSTFFAFLALFSPERGRREDSLFAPSFSSRKSRRAGRSGEKR
ncbi:hypothetical protein PUN28_019075 [Cardiocondyla obscurior]|uniref:Uncharacterized protein n=1 Tax=Cardiocondyla obscurior TaxID=286306 RepID=A0AAW2EJ61_9HYME